MADAFPPISFVHEKESDEIIIVLQRDGIQKLHEEERKRRSLWKIFSHWLNDGMERTGVNAEENPFLSNSGNDNTASTANCTSNASNETRGRSRPRRRESGSGSDDESEGSEDESKESEKNTNSKILQTLTSKLTSSVKILGQKFIQDQIISDSMGKGMEAYNQYERNGLGGVWKFSVDQATNDFPIYLSEKFTKREHFEQALITSGFPILAAKPEVKQAFVTVTGEEDGDSMRRRQRDSSTSRKSRRKRRNRQHAGDEVSLLDKAKALIPLWNSEIKSNFQYSFISIVFLIFSFQFLAMITGFDFLFMPINTHQGITEKLATSSFITGVSFDSINSSNSNSFCPNQFNPSQAHLTRR